MLLFTVTLLIIWICVGKCNELPVCVSECRCVCMWMVAHPAFNLQLQLKCQQEPSTKAVKNTATRNLIKSCTIRPAEKLDHQLLTTKEFLQRGRESKRHWGSLAVVMLVNNGSNAHWLLSRSLRHLRLTELGWVDEDEGWNRKMGTGHKIGLALGCSFLASEQRGKQLMSWPRQPHRMTKHSTTPCCAAMSYTRENTWPLLLHSWSQ